MAQLLSDRHSATTCADTCMRHIRLLRHVKGTEDLILAIEPIGATLKARKADTNAAAENKTAAYDYVVFNDAVLDDEVRNLSESCKQYDRKNPGRPVYDLLFPKGISPVIRITMENEPDEIEKLIKQIEALGEGHTLAGYIAPLQVAIDNSKSAISAYLSAITALKSAEALEDIAKTNLIRQYELNYYEALTKFGKVSANRLFPAISKSPAGNTEEPSATVSTDTKA
jgi:hypothetical protein